MADKGRFVELRIKISEAEDKELFDYYNGIPQRARTWEFMKRVRDLVARKMWFESEAYIDETK